jgi:hypothetical protein
MKLLIALPQRVDQLAGIPLARGKFTGDWRNGNRAAAGQKTRQQGRYETRAIPPP